jgi:hypothetical protein
MHKTKSIKSTVKGIFTGSGMVCVSEGEMNKENEKNR